jgi:hypothetical protein
MTKLETLIARARALPQDAQDDFVLAMESWLSAPPDEFGADGSDTELADRMAAWRETRLGAPADEVRAWLVGASDDEPPPLARRIAP